MKYTKKEEVIVISEKKYPELRKMLKFVVENFEVENIFWEKDKKTIIIGTKTYKKLTKIVEDKDVSLINKDLFKKMIINLKDEFKKGNEVILYR